MSRYLEVQDELRARPARWLVTGAAGFIGSNLVETLLSLGQTVVGLDNLATGHLRNLHEVQEAVGPEAAARFRFIEGDIRDPDTCRSACRDVRYVLHQAALGSVPRSIDDPAETNSVNVSGFVNMMVAARDAGVHRFVYAASSSTYGDDDSLPKVEDRIGQPLSPYAVSKYVNELYASVFHRVYGIDAVGLRYFNVFGPRQDPEGQYAAVIPLWVASLLRGQPCRIHGDGETSRDFCYVANVVQANLLAAASTDAGALNQVYNVALGGRTTLNELFTAIRDGLAPEHAQVANARPQYGPFRVGDVRHSQADTSRIRQRLGYDPAFDVGRGLDAALGWYVQNLSRRPAPAADAVPAR